MDPDYPGTAVERMMNARERVMNLARGALDGPWEEVRRNILKCGGLKDLPRARPGEGYTGHSFNDWNHCDLTCMVGDVSDNKNEGQVRNIARGNLLGPGIRVASETELGPGGSWSTCITGCNSNPPQDVAHIQFKARIAFKLVWCPPTFETFVLVDDDGKLLAQGRPSGNLPHIKERQMNYLACEGGRYATAAEAVGKEQGADR